MYFKARLPKEQRNSLDRIFNKEPYIFDTQKIGDNAIINAVNKEYIQDAIDCNGRIYYLCDRECIQIDYEVSFTERKIKVFLDVIENDDEEKMIVQHYLEVFINALVEAHTGSFECEILHNKKPEKLIIKTDERKYEEKMLDISLNRESINKNIKNLNETVTIMKEAEVQNKEDENHKDGEDKMISLAKVYNEINSQFGEEAKLNIKVYFEKNRFGVTIESSTELIADFIIAEKEFYTRKEKINSLVSTFETATFIETQVSNLVEKNVIFKKFFVMEQEIDENIGCPEGYTGYWSKNGNYVAM